MATVAFLRLIHDALLRSGPFPSADAFCDQYPELLDEAVLPRKFYSRQRLITEEAKQNFVEPDLAELPAESPAVA